MSIEYYRLKLPFTSARCAVAGQHTQLALWVNHAKAGEITLRNEEVPQVLLTLASPVQWAVIYGIGDGKAALLFNDDDLEPDTPLISERGELTCLAEIDPTSKMTEES